MYKIAILGSENTHSFVFAKIIRGEDGFGVGCPDFEIIGAYGNSDEANEKLNDRTLAETMIGTELYAPRGTLPELKDEETYYEADLLGLKVYDEEKNIVATVSGFYNFGAGDIIEIKVGQKLEMLPFNKDFVTEVCISEGYIIVREPVSAIDDGEENEG